jgi:hypothetical protein
MKGRRATSQFSALPLIVLQSRSIAITTDSGLALTRMSSVRFTHEEFGGSRNVSTGFAALRMQHSVLPNRVSVGVRKQWKRIPSRKTELLRLGGRVHADSHHFNAAPMKLAQVLLKTPQLGVAEWSPIPAIQNEHEPTMILQKIGGRDLLPSRI